MRRDYVLRVRILLGIVVAVGCVFIARLYTLQLVHGEGYVAEANQQYVRSAHDIFDRGQIFFSLYTGERIAAATLRTGYLLAINPSKLGDIDLAYQALSPYVEIDEAWFKERAHRTDDPYEEVARKITEEKAYEIAALGLPGVQLFREQWRYYPGDSLGAHVLGFVGYGTDGVVQRGQYGLERYWDSVLERERDQLYVNFFAEVFANVKETFSEEEYERHGDLIATIEPAVQQALERTLAVAQHDWHARELGGIVMDPKSGAVYAIAARPSFDPNNLGKEDPSVFRNPMVENVYEMGSIIKPIAMAIGLDTGAVSAGTTYDDTGSVVIDTATIRNYDGRARGVVNMQEVLNQSLNVGMTFVARQVGSEALGERMRAFGFGEETGIDLPFEVRGLIDNLESPREVEYATAAFGQGIALTPVETARALAALANGGYLVTPHLVSAIRYESGEERSVAPEATVRVLKPETSEEITRMLVEVVDTSLRGGAVKKEHYSIAAKTGTAQIAKEGERGYYDDRYLHSFFGYFPAYEPRFIIFLFHVEPQGARYASETLTDPFMSLVDFLINYYEVPPDR